MEPLPPDALKPRKAPRQARAEATLAAIFEATIQVLLANGGRGLTTTRVAYRAGVSVGTMYQYFPHKQALLYAVLRSHLANISTAFEAACQRGRGQKVAAMAGLLVDAFLGAKLERLDVTKALYLIAEDLDTTALLADSTDRNVRTTAALLATAVDAEFAYLDTVAFTAFSAISGTVRIAFERGVSEVALEELHSELSLMCRSYLQASRRPGRSGRPLT